MKDRIPESENIKLTIQGIPNVIHRGDFLEILEQDILVVQLLQNYKSRWRNNQLHRTAEIDSKGNWELSEPIIVPIRCTIWKIQCYNYRWKRHNDLKQWNVESDKKIQIVPLN